MTQKICREYGLILHGSDGTVIFVSPHISWQAMRSLEVFAGIYVVSLKSKAKIADKSGINRRFEAPTFGHVG